MSLRDRGRRGRGGECEYWLTLDVEGVHALIYLPKRIVKELGRSLDLTLYAC